MYMLTLMCKQFCNEAKTSPCHNLLGGLLFISMSLPVLACAFHYVYRNVSGFYDLHKD